MLARNYDRSAPILVMAVVDGDSPKESLTSLLESRFISLELIDTDSGGDKFKITIDNSDLAMLDDHRLSSGQVIRVSYGYLGAMTPPRDFVIKSVRGFLELQIEGLSPMTLMDREPRMRVFDGRRASDIVAWIAASYGYSGPLLHVEDSALILDHVQQRETDARLIKRLAAKLRWLTYIDHTGFHFHPRRLEMPSIRQYAFMHEVDGSHPGGDIVGVPRFEADFAGKAGLIKIVGRDPVTGESWQVSASNDETDREGLGPNLEIVDPAKARGRVMERVSRSVTTGVPGTRATAEQIARGEYILSSLGNYHVTINVVGDPQVSAKQIVELWGISDYLSGRYYVKECRTNFSPGNYSQQLKLMRDAAGKKEHQIAEDSAAAQGQGQRKNVLTQKDETVRDGNANLKTVRYYYRNGQQLREETQALQWRRSR